MPRVLEKKERRLGVKLGIKGERASSPKAASVRRPYAPGQHGRSMRRRPSEYGLQLQEKQKIKFTYALTEKQIRKVFAEAEKQEGVVSQNLLELLESRLDSVVFWGGFAPGRSSARQLVNHGHFMVNGRRVRVRSYMVKPGDVISIRPESKNIHQFKDLKEQFMNATAPVWLSVNPDKLEIKMESKPREVEAPFDINLVVDFYSR
jgi:small subunit ribosomal protein S4